MPHFLVAVQHPAGYNNALEGPEMMRDIGALNQEMVAAGVRVYAGGLEAAPKAKYVHKAATAITDGPFLEAKEYIGGFWILNCADMDEALTWAKKAAVACRNAIEVRAFLELPPR